MTTAPDSTPPAVAHLVADVRSAAARGPVWVIPTMFGQAALVVADGEGGFSLGKPFRRAAVSDARGLHLLTTSPDRELVPYYAGGGALAWFEQLTGWTVTLAGGGQ